MWEIYDRLIQRIPEEIIVDTIHQGPFWTVVTANSVSSKNKYCGIADTVNEQNLPPKDYNFLKGQSLNEVASLCKSWDFQLASVGMAAVNTWMNSWSRLSPYYEMKKDSNPVFSDTFNTFTDYAPEYKNKKVVIIGHYRNSDELKSMFSNLTILERNPREGDLPDPACEFILPQSDLVFITGSTFINKTVKRLLDLSQHAKTVIVGPSTPISSILFEYGVTDVSGLITGDITFDQILGIGNNLIPLDTIGKRIRMTINNAHTTI